ncbi:MAG: M14 family metallopeptidase [Gammaproteobacteria bacterium]|nr:M14 family metallopeptidase [Gammaproteobacteria bacterium]
MLDEIPDGLLAVPAQELHHYLAGPTLIRLKGRRDDVLFVSVLLHGNETTGWDAVRELLSTPDELPRGLYLFIGNVAAAAEGLRHLEGQVDFNRIWKESEKTPESEMAGQLLAELKAAPLFAALDVHNNTGINPHYGCINKLEREFFHLATLFSRTVVYFRRPDSVLSLALSELCPATTIECGKAGDKHGTEHAKEYIHACLHLQAFPVHEVAEHDIDVFHTVATVKVPEEIEFGIEEPEARLNFIGNMDRLNFQELKAGTVLGHVNSGKVPCLQAINEEGEDVAAQYFSTEKGVLRFAVPLMPSMITLDKDIIRQDCLCYLMERLDYHTLKPE